MTRAAVTSQPTQSESSHRAQEGWRRGKPEEDPEKTKRWGWIAAKPSEFLIRMRGGRVVSSGQGATVFKWPWDSVAIVPTTVQRLHFVADQITREKVGVRVTGIAVYRIAEPLIAFRMLNFSYPERAQEKLGEMMEEMCTGASRRLVANLTIEQCLTERKAALATELIREIAPVVEGTGRVEDATERGWGLVVDTIEIQDVRVLSAQVFANMQAPYRHEQERVAREAELAKLRLIKADETATEREVELTRVAAATEVRRQKQQADEEAKREKLLSDARVEEQRVGHERATRQAQLTTEREYQLAKTLAEQEVRASRQAAEQLAALEKVQAEARLQGEQRRAELEAVSLEAQTELARHAARLAAESQLAELVRAQVAVAEARRMLGEIEAKTVELEAHKQHLLGSFELDRAARLKEIDNAVSAESIQLAIANKLPEVAKAFQQQMGEVHVTAFEGANPYGYIVSAVEGVMDLARSAGLAAPKP